LITISGSAPSPGILQLRGLCPSDDRVVVGIQPEAAIHRQVMQMEWRTRGSWPKKLLAAPDASDRAGRFRRVPYTVSISRTTRLAFSISSEAPVEI